ncbi:MASE1 domain-containing protein [Nocardioidaceae bacterium]|nr:MASE1 domain-containing protein [Nocardioidaceae bacterium]
MTRWENAFAPAAGRADGPGSPARRWLVLALALTATILVSRMLRLPGSDLALFWPAAGVAVLGVAGARSRRELGVVLATVLLLAALGNLVTGAPWQAALVLGLANAVMAMVPALWLAYAPAPARAAHGGPQEPIGTRLRLTGPADLTKVSLALLVGGVASAVPGMAAMALLTEVTPAGVLSWTVRLWVGSVVVAVPALTLRCLTRHDDLASQPGSPHAWRVWARSRGRELVVLLTVSTVLVLVVFAPVHDLPVTYLPLVVAIWAGVRLPPAAAGAVATYVGVSTALVVLAAGGGPFADVLISASRTMTVQGYALLLVCVAMVLSLLIAQRDALAGRLAGAERRATQRAHDLTVVTDTVSAVLMVLTDDGQREMMNPSAVELLGAAAGDDPFAGWRRTDGTALAHADAPHVRALRGRTVRHEIVLEPTGRGEPRAWTVDALALPEREDGVGRALVVMRDVTAERAHVSQLEAFAGIVAHDLQNPVTAIKGWTDVAIEELDIAGVDQDAGVREALQRVRGAGDRATALIHDLLDYSVGRTAAIHRVTVDLDMMAAAVVAGIEHAYADRRPRISLGALGSVSADPVLLSQVVTNLVGNAVKYTPPGQVPDVRIEATREGGEVTLSVLDRGVGVPASQRTAVFEPFTRAHGDDSRFSGTGLGLAICAQAVHRHGGRIGVEPRGDGPGSRFFVAIPDREPVRRPAAPASGTASAATTATATETVTETVSPARSGSSLAGGGR